MKKLTLIIALIVFSQFVYSQLGTCKLSDEWKSGGWESLCLLTMSIVLTFLSLVYALNVVFKKPEWYIWVKDEFYQAIISFAILIAVFGVTQVLCDVSSSLSYSIGAGGDPFSIANLYLNDLIWQKTLNLANNIFMLGIYARVSAAYALDLSVVRWFPSAGLNAIAQNLDFLYAIVIGISGSLLFQSIGLQLIRSFAFRIILPFGIFFRIFPFTRKAGATFIAVALGLYIVYPLCFVMDKLIMDTIITKYPDLITTFAIDYAWFVGTTLATMLIQYNFTVYGPARSAMGATASLLPQALFLPTLNLIITLTFINSATKVLSQNFAEEFG
jgi:hypothetical protein